MLFLILLGTNDNAFASGLYRYGILVLGSDFSHWKVDQLSAATLSRSQPTWRPVFEELVP